MFFQFKSFAHLRRLVIGLILAIVTVDFFIAFFFLRFVFGFFNRPHPQVAFHSSARQVSPSSNPPPSTAPMAPEVTVTPQMTPNSAGNAFTNRNSVPSSWNEAQQSAANIQRILKEAEEKEANAREISRSMLQEAAKLQQKEIQSRNVDGDATRYVMNQPSYKPVPQSYQLAQPGMSADEVTNIAKQIGNAQAQIDKLRDAAEKDNYLALQYRWQYKALKQQADYLFSEYDKCSMAASDAQNQANLLSQQANELASRHAWWGNPDELSAKSYFFQHQAEILNYQANQIRENANYIQSEYSADLSKANLHESNAKYANQQILYYQNQIKYYNGLLHSK